MEAREAEVTDTVADPETAPEEAMIEVEPAATPVANPAELTVAMFALLELQVTLLVISVELPSAKTPLAVKA